MPEQLTPKKQRIFRNTKRKSQKSKKLSYKERNALLEQEIAKLYEGQSFDNWLHLFDEIDAYYPSEEGGSSKKSVQEDIKRYIEIEKQPNSQQLTIKQIYAEPIEKEKNFKGGSKGIYYPLLKSLLLYSLSQETGYTKEFTYTQFWLEMGMRNRFYTNEEIRKALPEYDKEITEEDLEDFFRRTGIKNKNITDYLLDALQDECLLRHEKHMMIRKGYEEPRYATDEEVSLIGTTEKKIMEEWGFSTKQEVFLANKSRVLYKKTKEIVGFSYYEQFKVYVYGEDVLRNEIIKTIEQIKATINAGEITNDLTSRIMECDVKSAEKRHNKELEKLNKEYENYDQKIAIGMYKEHREEYIADHGNPVVKQNDYSTKYEKMNQYFTSRTPNDCLDLLRQIEYNLEEEKRHQQKSQNGSKPDQD